MPDINAITLDSAGSPVTHYYIEYTKTRPSNFKMTYNFTVKCYLNSLSSYHGNGVALLGNITINGASTSFRIKESAGEWRGTTPRYFYPVVSCDSTVGNQAQTVAFKVVSDGTYSDSAGTINNSSYSVTSSALLYTKCGAPTACSVSPDISEGNANLVWNGASSGINNAIINYEIQYSGSSNGSAWGAWTALSILSSASSSGSANVAPPPVRGNYYRYKIRAQGAAGSGYYSDWKESTNNLRRDKQPEAPKTFLATQANYSTQSILINWLGASSTTSPIKGYQISSRISNDNASWGAWSILTTINLNSTGGLYNPTVTRENGVYTQFGIYAIDTLNVYSDLKISAYIYSNQYSRPMPPELGWDLTAYIYNSTPLIPFAITANAAGLDQYLYVSIDGVWYNSKDNPDMFKPMGGSYKNGAKVFFICPEIHDGKGNIKYKVSDLTTESETVLKDFTKISITKNYNMGDTVLADDWNIIRLSLDNLHKLYRYPIKTWSVIQKGVTPVNLWLKHALEAKSRIEEFINWMNNWPTSPITIPNPSWIETGFKGPRADVMNQIIAAVLNL